MSTYVIGDIQGCYTELQRLLRVIQFNPRKDVLWCTGDLVNRGPQSLEVLRFFKQLDSRAIVVLGNHDLHLLAVAHNNFKHFHSKDTLLPVLQAPDRTELIEWLRHCPFLHHDPLLDVTLIHAGFPPQWDLLQAFQCAKEIETILQGIHYQDYLSHLYGDKPQQWSDDLRGWERLRFATNCFTRLRYCTARGELVLKKKGTPNITKTHWNDEEPIPWFLIPHRATRNNCIVFGHWSTLGYYAGHHVYGLDSGCLWGGSLTALRLEDRQMFSVSCQGECKPEEI